MGPTAAGKTDLAIELTKVLPCELISVDSALIYRGMDIGSAKPSKAVLAAHPHRLIDIRDPAESYSAAQFRADALQAMAEISGRGKIPLLVGGTMLYYKALVDGLADMPAADAGVRAELKPRRRPGAGELHRQLAEVDPVSAARIHPNDPQRLIRALEVYRVSGESMTAHRQRQFAESRGADAGAGGHLPYTVASLAIATDRHILHQRIALRFSQMLNRALSTRSDHCEPEVTCTPGYRLYGQWGIGKSGITWTASCQRVKCVNAVSSRPGSWPNGSSPGCVAGLTYTG